MPGSRIAAAILSSEGLADVEVAKADDASSGRYDLRVRKVYLGAEAYAGDSVTSAATAAHECGHALQHRDLPRALAFAEVVGSVAAFCSALWPLVFAAGAVLGARVVMGAGVFALGIALACQLLRLGVELGASRRALASLRRLAEEYLAASLTHAEMARLQAVLLAAALTYVLTVAVSGLIELAHAMWRAVSQE